jgi:hypothetical protein
MKRLAPILILTVFSACASFEAPPAQEKKDLENRKFVVRVVSYDIGASLMHGLRPEDTVHLDALVFDILSPSDFKGRNWHLFIYNKVWSPKEDYGYRAGDVLEIDIPKIKTTTGEISNLLESKEWMVSFWITNDLISRPNQTVEPTAPSGRGSP